VNLKEEESYRLRRAPVVWRVNRQSIEKKREGVLSPPYEQGNEFERPPRTAAFWFRRVPDRAIRLSGDLSEFCQIGYAPNRQGTNAESLDCKTNDDPRKCFTSRFTHQSILNTNLLII